MQLKAAKDLIREITNHVHLEIKMKDDHATLPDMHKTHHLCKHKVERPYIEQNEQANHPESLKTNQQCDTTLARYLCYRSLNGMIYDTLEHCKPRWAEGSSVVGLCMQRRRKSIPHQDTRPEILSTLPA